MENGHKDTRQTFKYSMYEILVFSVYPLRAHRTSNKLNFVQQA